MERTEIGGGDAVTELKRGGTTVVGERATCANGVEVELPLGSGSIGMGADLTSGEGS